MSAALLTNTFLASDAVLPSTGAAPEALKLDKRRYVSSETVRNETAARKTQSAVELLLSHCLYVLDLRLCLTETNMNDCSVSVEMYLYCSSSRINGEATSGRQYFNVSSSST
jgi:hypothetical protein